MKNWDLIDGDKVNCSEGYRTRDKSCMIYCGLLNRVWKGVLIKRRCVVKNCPRRKSEGKEYE